MVELVEIVLVVLDSVQLILRNLMEYGITCSVGFSAMLIFGRGVSSQTDSIYVVPMTINEKGGKVTRHVVSTLAAGRVFDTYDPCMPSLNSNGDATGGNSVNCYCDDNHINGEWCWKMNVIEENMYAAPSTLHKCYQSPGQVTYSCDTAGCGTNCHCDNNSAYCPGSSCIINTQDSFDVLLHLVVQNIV